MREVHCPLCPEGTGARPYHEEGGFRAVQCDGCGLVYVTPRPTEAEMKRLYEGQDSHIDLAAQIRKRHRKSAEAEASLHVLSAFAQHGRLLEIGVGAGWFLVAARARGYRVTGLDINAHFVVFAREALGLDVVEGTLRATDLGRARFDVVFHRNVLSHLARPVEELVRMAELLRPDGIMLFETGNVAELPGSTWRGTTALALPDHLFHFSEATLRTLLDRTGFDCLEVRRAAVLGALPPLWAMRRAFARRDGAGDGAPITAPAAKRPFQPPSKPPPRSRIRAAIAGAWRRMHDGTADALGGPGKRCSLTVVARRRP